MNSYKIADIKPGSFFSEDLFVDNAFLLVPAQCTVSAEQLMDLNEWGFTQLYTNGSVKADETPAPAADAAQQGAGETKAAAPQDNSVDGKTETVDASEFLEGEDNGPTLPKKEPEQKKAPPVNSYLKAQAKLEEVRNTYYKFYDYIAGVYNGYVSDKALNKAEIMNTADSLCEFVKNNRRDVLRITSSMEIDNKHFLISHCMRSTVIAITIGLQLKLPQDKMMELATASIMHEIGMILLPPQLYMNDKPLTGPEKLMITTHPIVSYNILKKANFSLPMQLAVLEHHERMNGSGYPRHVTGDKISLYAKIIATACSFEAITAPREYKEERSSYEALLELLRNANHQYDDTVTKVLLYSISLYPIGVYVYLSNGKIAQVVDVVPGQPKTPFVQVLGETAEDGSPKVVQVDLEKLRIIRVLNKKEVQDTLSALEKMSNNEE